MRTSDAHPTDEDSMTEAERTRILLIVEDNLADADLVKELLAETGRDHYEVHHVARLADARTMLTEKEVDVVLLDLRLPDASGPQGVVSLMELNRDLPVVVLTGMNDERLASECISIGAQDYLNKDELRPELLRRSLRYSITRVREAQRLRAALARSDFLLGEVHHRVRNNLQQILAIIYIETSRLRSDEGRAALESVARRVRALADVHGLLVVTATDTVVDISELLHRLVSSVAEGQGLPERGIAVTTHAARRNVPVDVAVSIGLLVGELVTNAVKHAFPNEGGGEIRVEFADAGEAGARLSVSDNGAGAARSAFEEGQGAGMNIVRQLLIQLAAEHSIESENGTRIEIRIPADKLDKPPAK